MSNGIRVEITLLGLLQIFAGLFLFDGLGQKVLSISGLFLVVLGFFLFRGIGKREETDDLNKRELDGNDSEISK